MSLNPITVSQLNFYIKSLLDGNDNLKEVFLLGEISNFTDHYKSGHFYFSLKDQKSVIKCVMFSRFSSRVRFRPEDGMKVLLRGSVSVYEATGQYQVYVEDLRPEGIGSLNLAFEQLKAKLEKEGLFSPERKRPLPRFPEKIGVITSPTGAAVRDIESILRRRYPLAEVIFCPVLVQGDAAPAQLVDAIGRMNAIAAADVLIIGRGGGSMEDLWAFNDESVARAVAYSQIPVISAVGHETDFTICDFAADLRAPTPSAAAELAVPDQEEMLTYFAGRILQLRQDIGNRMEREKEHLNRLAHSPALRSPLDIVERHRIALDALSAQLCRAFEGRLVESQKRFASVTGKLQALSPLNVLSRGYAIAQKESKIIKSVHELENKDQICLRLKDGNARCQVLAVDSETGGLNDEKSEL